MLYYNIQVFSYPEGELLADLYSTNIGEARVLFNTQTFIYEDKPVNILLFGFEIIGNHLNSKLITAITL